MFLSRFFEPKAFNEGYLPEENGHLVAFMEFGNPKGEPVLITHGGPGGSCKPKHVKDFDLKKYRVIMLDQRGCGKSHPRGQWNNNTTQDTISDMNRLLDLLGIEQKIILKGGSWASTLALLFAEKYPEKVKALILSQVFLANEDSRKWEEAEVVKFYPDVWEKMTKDIKGVESVSSHYFSMLISGEAKKQLKALSLYGTYERNLGSLSPCLEVKEIDEDRLLSARIYANYCANKFFVKDNQILKNIKKIAKIPTLIVHNRLDFLCPLLGAYQIHKAISASKLVIVADKGHVSKLLYKAIKKETKEFLKNVG